MCLHIVESSAKKTTYDIIKTFKKRKSVGLQP